MIDEGLVLPFKGPSSFTGEDVVEFHLHGSAAVEIALYEALSSLGARPAAAGEFTKRALLNGKLDLAEVEGLADLLDAETALQRKQALGQFGGRLSAVAEGWRRRLVAILAPLEAGVDFPDEADVPATIAARAGPEIEALLAELKSYLAGAGKARAIREGVGIAIIGPPNAGKSSLLNRLAGSERAIVAETPGTTRDVIEARLDLGGMLASLLDTAGLREAAADPVEAEGMRRTRINAEEADIRLLMIDAAAAGDVSRETFGAAGYDLVRPGDFIVLNKIDLPPPETAARLRPPPKGEAGARGERDAEVAATLRTRSPHLALGGRSEFAKRIPGGGKISPEIGVFRISARTGEGVDALLDALTTAVAERCGQAEGAGLTRARHVAAVTAAISDLERAAARLDAPELAAEDVRLAARCLGGITGAVGVEDVLDAIFASFCIGK